MNKTSWENLAVSRGEADGQGDRNYECTRLLEGD